MLNKKSLISFT